MAATDYIFTSDENGIYLSKQLKSNKPSQDKREVTEKEILGLFGCFLTRYCKANSTDTINITIDDKPVYMAKLLGVEAATEETETPTAE